MKFTAHFHNKGEMLILEDVHHHPCAIGFIPEFHKDSILKGKKQLRLDCLDMPLVRELHQRLGQIIAKEESKNENKSRANS